MRADANHELTPSLWMKLRLRITSHPALLEGHSSASSTVTMCQPKHSIHEPEHDRPTLRGPTSVRRKNREDEEQHDVDVQRNGLVANSHAAIWISAKCAANLPQRLPRGYESRPADCHRCGWTDGLRTRRPRWSASHRRGSTSLRSVAYHRLGPRAAGWRGVCS